MEAWDLETFIPDNDAVKLRDFLLKVCNAVIRAGRLEDAELIISTRLQSISFQRDEALAELMDCNRVEQ